MRREVVELHGRPLSVLRAGAERGGEVPAGGGFGPELTILLRLASVPGVVEALSAAASLAPRPLTRLARQAALSTGLCCPAHRDTVTAVARALSDRDHRHAVMSTLREAVSWSGQRIDATDQLYLLAHLPILLIAGRGDTCIPYQHTLHARELLPDARLRVLDAGHFPHSECPEQVAELITEHVDAAGVRRVEGRVPSSCRWPAEPDTRRALGRVDEHATPRLEVVSEPAGAA